MADEQQPFILSFAPILQTMPVSIDAATSINLAKVRTYQAAEVKIFDKKGNDTGKTEFKPCVFFGADDFIALSPEQNEMFKFYWNIYTRAAGMILQSMSQMFPAPPPPVADGK